MVSREELYNLVWSMPMTQVAARFDVSGSYMARVCSALGVPRPERGYWAKLAVGRAPARPPLPEPRPGDQCAWDKASGLTPPPTPKPTPTPIERPRKGKAKVTGTHALIRGAKAHFEETRRIDSGQHLKPYKKLLVDITVSSTCLDKALNFSNDLFNALETAGHRVVFAPPDAHFGRQRIDFYEQPPKRANNYSSYEIDSLWHPHRPTIACVGSVAFGLAIIELSEETELRYVNGEYVRASEYVSPKSRRYLDSTWTTTRNLPCGRLKLVAYAPYRDVSWSKSFIEAKGRSFTKDIPNIVKAIESSEPTMSEERKAAERRAEEWRQKMAEQHREWELQEDRRRTEKSIKDSREQLDQVIQSWADVNALEQFFQGVQDRAQQLPADARDEVMERLRLAREFVGTQDPMDFFLSWRTPMERYLPLAMRGQNSTMKVAEDENDE